jgi:hypothetical protein
VRGDLKIRGYTVGQFPNPPLWIALAAFATAELSGPRGTLHAVARAIEYMALTAWAYLELTEGVNGFRRAVGALALTAIAIAVARAIS